MREAHHEIFATDDAETALRIFQDEDIDLTITGLWFPKFVGTEISLKLRKVRPDARVWLCTTDEELYRDYEHDLERYGLERCFLKRNFLRVIIETGLLPANHFAGSK